LGYKESLHIENPPVGESQTTKSGGTEGRPTETVAVVPPQGSILRVLIHFFDPADNMYQFSLRMDP